MAGHHLVMGELTDYLTGDTLEDTHDERYRQRLARMLVETKHFALSEIVSRHRYTVRCDSQRAVIPIDFLIRVKNRVGMMIKYGPGSLVTRRQPAVAAARVVTVPAAAVAIATNGESADVMDSRSGKLMAQGLDGIPDRDALAALLDNTPPWEPGAELRERSERILFAYEVDGACPCDDTVCRL